MQELLELQELELEEDEEVVGMSNSSCNNNSCNGVTGLTKL